MPITNKKFTWDTNMLKRFYEKYVVNWLHRDQNWTEQEKLQAVANLGMEGVESAATFALDMLTSGVPKSNLATDVQTTLTHADDVYSHFIIKKNANNTVYVDNANNVPGNTSNSALFGTSLEVQNNSEVALGKFNKSRSNLQFSIGAGTSTSDRKNVFEVENAGDVYIIYDNQKINLQGALNTIINAIESQGVTVTITPGNVPDNNGDPNNEGQSSPDQGNGGGGNNSSSPSGPDSPGGENIGEESPSTPQ